MASVGGPNSIKCAIYRHSDNSKIGETGDYTDYNYGPDWYTFNFSDPKPSLTAGTEYVLVATGSESDPEGVYIYYDDNDNATLGHYQEYTSYGFPTTASFTHEARKYSIYCSYTAGVGAPSVTTNAATSVETTTATLNANLTDNGGENPSRLFDWDNDSGVPYAHADNIGIGGTGAYTDNLTGLSPGTKYYFRARAVNSGGTGTGSELTFSTKPGAPTNLDAKNPTLTTIDLTWTKGSGAENTIIRRKTGSYPDNYADGTLVYSGTGTSTTDVGLDNSTQYFYRAWAWDENDKYSDNYSQDNETTLFGEWATPSSVENKCGESSPNIATNAIDNDTSTYWRHTVYENHWIVFDMGASRWITKIRLYNPGDVPVYAWGGTYGLVVYVSDNTENWGDNVWEGALYAAGGWVENASCVFLKRGRYLKLVSKNSPNGANERMYEFQAYAEVVPAWKLIETWTGTVSAPAEWQLIETWTGTVSAPAEWKMIETWTGTVSAPAQWQVVESWTGTVEAPVTWQLVEMWTGTIEAPAQWWRLIETWTGTVAAPAAWQMIETWTGTVSAPVQWRAIEAWTGVVQAPAVWQIIESWTGAVSAPTAWHLVESWTGTVQAPAQWQLVETWTGTVEALVPTWQLIETWTGTVSAPVQWRIVETWAGTVRAPAVWQLIESWTGSIEAPAAWQLIETWTGTVEALPAAWQLIESWTGTVEAPRVWRLIETWIGTVEAPAIVSDFTISVSPTSGSVQQGGWTTATVTVTSINNYGLTVSLEASSLSSSIIIASFSPPSGIPNFNSTMTINVGSNGQVGDHTITITGRGGDGRVRSCTYVLTVTAAAPAPTPPLPPPGPIMPTPTQPQPSFYAILSIAVGIVGFIVAYRLLARPSKYYVMLKRVERAVVRPKTRRIGRSRARPPVRGRKKVSRAEAEALKRLEHIVRERKMKSARKHRR